MAKRAVEGMRTEAPSEAGKRTSVPAIPGSGDVKAMPNSDEKKFRFYYGRYIRTYPIIR
ncbi:hypothetical protein OL548_19990 [Lysinibacillus sp. MHQ-1]|nr:hypothetical protein OL548_19990 [Lysinibacillus sp. MHQ-1]